MSGVCALLPWTAEEFQCICGVPKAQLCTLREDGGAVCSLLLSFGPAVELIAVLQIMLSPDARNTAWVSFDGRKRQEICHGDRSDLSSDCVISKYRKSWFMQLPHSLASAKKVFGSEEGSFYKPQHLLEHKLHWKDFISNLSSLDLPIKAREMFRLCKHCMLGKEGGHIFRKLWEFSLQDKSQEF